ncbi:hypothetical protein EAE99_006596 [Botrytis elliptica]|nr:hypothetical protein EAE99_006596 [Botrytis elliptica]
MYFVIQGVLHAAVGFTVKIEGYESLDPLNYRAVTNLTAGFKSFAEDKSVVNAGLGAVGYARSQKIWVWVNNGGRKRSVPLACSFLYARSSWINSSEHVLVVRIVDLHCNIRTNFKSQLLVINVLGENWSQNLRISEHIEILAEGYELPMDGDKGYS